MIVNYPGPVNRTMSSAVENVRSFEDVETRKHLIYREVPVQLRNTRDSFCIMAIIPCEGEGLCAISIMGTRGTLEEAQEYAKCLSEDNDFLNYYIVSCYDWAVLPPPKLSAVAEIHHKNEQMEKISQNWCAKIKKDAELMRERLANADERRNAIEELKD